MSKLGGDARPVQRPPPTKELSPGPESGYGFLSKSNKGAAFDFVQDEMTQMKQNFYLQLRGLCINCLMNI